MHFKGHKEIYQSKNMGIIEFLLMKLNAYKCVTCSGMAVGVGPITSCY